MKLLDFIHQHFTTSAKKRIKQAIETNHCLVNQQMERFASAKLSAGDTVHFDELGLVKEEPKASFQSKHILFEDPFLLIYNKPAGVSSDPSGILQLLKPHGNYLLTHRLDKETSGALILAKSREVEAVITEAFRLREIQKEYLALVDGIPKLSEGVIENYLGKVGGYEGQTIYGKVSAQQGKKAKTVWKVRKKSGKNAVLIQCFPETGRTHQIRVHLSEMGHPILGDYQYGKKFKSSFRPSRLLLHAYRLELLHPTTKLQMKIEAPIPKDFQEAMSQLW